MKLKLIPIKNLKWDKTIYPRTNYSFVSVAKYRSAMQTGEKFPPICVAPLPNGFYAIIDGVHRWNVFKQLKHKTIQCEVLPLMSDREMFAEAVKRNSRHGAQFSPYETTKIILTLQDYKFKPMQIQDIVHMPVKVIGHFMAGRVTGRVGSPNEEIALKTSTQHFANTGTLMSDKQEFAQRRIIGSQSIETIDSLINLLENNMLNKSKKVKARMKILFTLIKQKLKFR